MADVKINDNIYSGVAEIQIPLAEGSGNASFRNTDDATVTADTIVKGYTGYGPAGKVVGNLEIDSFLEKIGEYDVKYVKSSTDLEYAVVKNIVPDIAASEYYFNDSANSEVRAFVLRQELDKTNTNCRQFHIGIGHTKGSKTFASYTCGYTYNASGFVSVAAATISGRTNFTASETDGTGYDPTLDLPINQFDKFPSGKVTAYIVKVPF